MRCRAPDGSVRRSRGKTRAKSRKGPNISYLPELVRKLAQYCGANSGGAGGVGGAGGGAGRGGGDDDEDLMLDVLDGEGIAMSVVSTTGGSSS
ncbi:hypothetical protein R5R35_006376 [Gryllus longicercus]|uniref:Uncharacterized protein n=1 Tax=Gryllus longicercus TaxID=2509291 RepID=A0AAN9W000_9ORTH